tara:strand:+ start:368 stop:547 length:180 start_codon:yes stop_codon:yes gene_type:complete
MYKKGIALVPFFEIGSSFHVNRRKSDLPNLPHSAKNASLLPYHDNTSVFLFQQKREISV